jgi:uncharacterized protein YigA (DUF484 family)
MTATLLDDATQARVVAAYLKRHPEFLSEYPELAAALTMPRGEQGAVSSLAVYQLQSLRDKNAELERKLAELIGIAAENEKLMERVHALTVALLRANTMEVTARSVVAKLSADFHTEQVRLVLFGNEPPLPRADWLLQEPTAEALPEFAEFLRQNEPVSGRLSAEKLTRLFGAAAKDIQSVAMMRLGDAGMLAIGSSDPDRFQPGMGTLFLKMISATITAALARARDVS